jgi:WD40 repeat protein/uncharacterized caspase-like protein
MLIQSLMLIAAICANPEPQPRLQVQVGHTSRVKAVAVDPKGRFIVTGGMDKKIKLWSADGARILSTGELPSAPEPSRIVFAPDGESYITCDGGGMLISYSSIKERTWSLRNSSKFGSGGIGACAYSPDGSYIVGVSGREAYRWDIKGGKVWDNGNYGEGKTGVAVSKNGVMVTVSLKGEIQGYSMTTGKHLWNRQDSKNRGIANVIYDPARDRFIAVGNGGFLAMIDEKGTIREYPTGSHESQNIYEVALSPDGKRYATGGSGGVVVLWNSSWDPVATVSKSGPATTSLAFSADGTKLYTSNWDDQWVNIYSAADGTPAGKLGGDLLPIKAVAFTPDGTGVTAGGQGGVRFYDLDGRLRKAVPMDGWVKTVTYSRDGKKLFLGTDMEWMILKENGTVFSQRKYDGVKINSSDMSLDGTRVTMCRNGTLAVFIIDEKGQAVLQPGSLSGGCDLLVRFHPDGVRIGTAIRSAIKQSFRDMVLYEPGKSRVEFEGGAGLVFQAFAFSQDGNLIFGSDSTANSQTSYGPLSLWTMDGKVKQTYRNDGNANILSTAIHSGAGLVAWGDGKGLVSISDFNGKYLGGYYGAIRNPVLGMAFSPDGRHLAFVSSESTTHILDVKTGKSVMLVSKFDGEWLAIGDDYTFDASPGGGSLVLMTLGRETFGVDQFAFLKNRPDLVLGSAGLIDDNTRAFYKAQYLKRLRRAGLDETKVSARWHVPTASIESNTIEGKFATVKGKCADGEVPLRGYNIYVNDVPLFGGGGKPVQGNEAAVTERIELGAGKNKIELSCFNEQRAESYRALVLAEYNGPVKRNLYYLGFGVSKYQNSKLSLMYAAKDAADLAGVFGKMAGGAYGKVNTRVFTDQQVTKQNVKAAKAFLKTAKVDDVLVLFIAGHGVHDNDQDATYYYLPYGANTGELAATAIDFDSIESLLMDVSPRQKLFLMDTCESGEIEDASAEKFFAAADLGKVKARTTRGIKKAEGAQKPEAPRTALMQKDRYIFNDLVRRSGAIVFSSSKGGEFSYEKEELENGLFTEEVLRALSTAVADENKDGVVTTDELRRFVSRAVAEDSANLQHPTVDRDNLTAKFAFPVTKSEAPAAPEESKAVPVAPEQNK